MNPDFLVRASVVYAWLTVTVPVAAWALWFWWMWASSSTRTAAVAVPPMLGWHAAGDRVAAERGWVGPVTAPIVLVGAQDGLRPAHMRLHSGPVRESNYGPDSGPDSGPDYGHETHAFERARAYCEADR